MKKKFKMENLDCANCAAKMETAINKIAGVKEATVSFMTQRLVIVLSYLQKYSHLNKRRDYRKIPIHPI